MLDPASSTNGAALTKSGSGRGSNGGAASAAAPALPMDGSVTKLKGLPFKATTDDIIRFFSGFSLKNDSIYLRRHADGRPNGEAFVAFENADEARRACSKDRDTFNNEKYGDRYCRVYPVLESDVPDMQAAVAQSHTFQGHTHIHGYSDSVVKIKSLPFDATQLDIIQFFEQFRLKPNGVQLVVRSDNKPMGEAFVDFESPEEAVRAIREKDHKIFCQEKFGDRYVRLIQVSRKEMQATLALRFGGEGILKMKGIPFKATAADVRKFFAGYKIKPEGVSFIMHTDGRPTGMAFIEFETPQEAVKAMEKDRAKFGVEYGDRFCMLQLVGRHEMDKVALQRESDSPAAKLLMGPAPAGLNVLQAAAMQAATQAALNNPALQPLLMGPTTWLNPAALHLGLVNPANPGLASAAQLGMGQVPQLPVGNGPSAGPVLDATLAASLPLSAAAPSAGMGGLNLLQQSHAAGLGGSSMSEGSSWVDPTTAAAAAMNLTPFYQNGAHAPMAQEQWTGSPAAAGRGLGAGMPIPPGWQDQYAAAAMAAARHRQSAFAGPAPV